MRKGLVGGLCLALGGLAVRTQAGDTVQWRPAAVRPAAVAPAVPYPSATPGVSLGQPIPAALGRPVPLDEPGRMPAALLDRQLTPAGFNAQPPVVRGQDDGVARRLPSGPPGEPHFTAVAASPGAHPPPPEPVTSMAPGAPAPNSPYEIYNSGAVADPVGGPGFAPPPPVCCEPIDGGCDPAGGGGQRDTGLFGLFGNFQWFKSDHAFDQMISPLSNPFLFEDPRALTEVRPIYIYQRMGDPNVSVNNGSINWFGTQARLAITDRWSIVMNKLGGIDFDPGSNSLVPGGCSFSEFWIGPKYTIIRGTQSGTLLALGLTFQFPTGQAAAFQNTGDLSLTPYLSFAQTFGKSSYGAFNFMATTGYTFSTDNTRTDYYFASLHLDYDIANLHKIYPLLELSWFHYGKNGGGMPTGFEGRDLINFGNGAISGHDGVTMAAGVRYKFTEWAQAGLGIEFPLSNTKADLLDYRIMLDVIFRY